MHVDYLIVGSGLTGAVIARCLVDAGKRVLILDRRPHIGGNVADMRHASGINIHVYGPHLFRTNSDAIWEFVGRFTHFTGYMHQVKTRVNDGLVSWPIVRSDIERICGKNWRPEIRNTTPQNFEEAALSMMPRVIYETFVKPYTEKQWGVPPHTLDARLCRRFTVHQDDSPYFTPNAKYQGLPVGGYSTMVRRILEGIPVLLNVDYLACREDFAYRKALVFTGSIDEYFGFELGKLMYRGQRRQEIYNPDVDRSLPCAVINYPSDVPYVRDTEWKHMMPAEYADRIRGTVITRETPFSPANPEHYEYPFPDEANRLLHEAYQTMAKEEPGTLICGRLGEYRYYDMDQAIGRALELAEQLLSDDLRHGVT